MAGVITKSYDTFFNYTGFAAANNCNPADIFVKFTIGQYTMTNVYSSKPKAIL